jgi:hypothetical protein
LVSGAPSETPQSPFDLENSIEIASIYLPSYLCNVSDAQLEVKMYRRYRMEDIKKLEDRISNLEYYTSLTLLESDTSKLFIPDQFGLNRFKSGFFVDNFSNTDSQEKTTIIKNSIDIDNNELRPAHYTTALDLILATKSIIGVGTIASSNVDLRYNDDILGTNIRKTGNVITLDYDEVVEITQPYSTRVENVAAYRSNTFSGSVTLFPPTDVWADQVKVSTNYVSAKSFTPSASQLSIIQNNSQSGLNPVLWNYATNIWAGGNTVLSAQIINQLRSRNIEFSAKRLKPYTRQYVFFDNRSMSRFVVPKLIQIQMVSGTFQVGETVIGRNSTTNANIKFRVASSNHKDGPYNSPTTIFTQNPYSPDNTVPAIYSSTSSILNVDTFSLSNMAQSGFAGYIDSGMRLKGQTSNAEAIILSDIKLITDSYGDVMGSLFIPNGNVTGVPAFETGSKLFRITDSVSNSLSENGFVSFAETNFVSAGSLINYQENIIRTETRNIPNRTTPSNTQTARASSGVRVQQQRPWRDGDLSIRGKNISDDEGNRLVNSINERNGTSFTLSQLKSAAGINQLNKVAELNRINEAARRLAGR